MYAMAKGTSGRIVIEIDPALKRQLYAKLEKEGMTLKDWFLKKTDKYLYEEGEQLSLRFTDTATERRFE